MSQHCNLKKYTTAIENKYNNNNYEHDTDRTIVSVSRVKIHSQ